VTTWYQHGIEHTYKGIKGSSNRSTTTYHHKEWLEKDQMERWHHQLFDRFRKWNPLPNI